MLKRTLTLSMVLLLVFSITPLVFGARGVLTASGKTVKIGRGENVLSGAGFNDSAGSSDLSLIIQLKADDKILIDEGSACKAIEPKKNLPSDKDPTGWTQPKYDDSAWQDAKYGVGYGDGDDMTVIGSKATNTASVYSRAKFNIDDPSAIKKLTLGADYDDACVIWINGVEVARTSGTDIPANPTWDSWSDKGSGQSHEASKTKPPTYEFVEVKFEAISGAVAVEPAGKLTTTWAKLKNK